MHLFCLARGTDGRYIEKELDIPYKDLCYQARGECISVPMGFGPPSESPPTEEGAAEAQGGDAIESAIPSDPDNASSDRKSDEEARVDEPERSDAGDPR